MKIKKFIYQEIRTHPSTNFTHLLNDQGQDGWELVQVIVLKGLDGKPSGWRDYIFKKEILEFT